MRVEDAAVPVVVAGGPALEDLPSEGGERDLRDRPTAAPLIRAFPDLAFPPGEQAVGFALRRPDGLEDLLALDHKADLVDESTARSGASMDTHKTQPTCCVTCCARKYTCILAEEEGFEPPELALNGFQDRRLRPLGHSSMEKGLIQHRGRGSSPPAVVAAPSANLGARRCSWQGRVLRRPT